MKKITLIVLFIFTVNHLKAQDQLGLEECYNLVTKNFPTAKQSEYYATKNALDLDVIKTDKLPKVDFSAQATYQSDVTHMPISIPNSTVEPPNKDQYKATVTVNQLIYSGGLINASEKAKTEELKTQQKQVEVNLYQLKKQVNQLYFTALLIQEKTALLHAKKNQLSTKLKEVKSGIKYGAILPTSDKILEAELLKIDQQIYELSLSKSTTLNALSKLIGTPITNETQLKTPEILTSENTEIERPELDLFNLQKNYLETSEAMISKQNTPKLLGFATGGYGNPGLNMLDNSFQTYYHVGVKLNWNIFDWNANKKQRESLLINKEIINSEEEAFLLNTTIEMDKQHSEIEKLTKLIETDFTIIDLRKEVVTSAASQLKNGVITSSAYITEFTNLYEAENDLKTHTIELLQAKANYNLTKGNF